MNHLRKDYPLIISNQDFTMSNAFFKGIRIKALLVLIVYMLKYSVKVIGLTFYKEMP